MPGWLRDLSPILMLLVAVSIVFWRLPKVDLGHSEAFKKRRLLNWLPLGLTYAFLYMGRYNLTVSKNALGDLMTKDDFGTIFFWGTLTYGCAFLINGPLADRFGGRKTILAAAAGSGAMNILLGVITWAILTGKMEKSGLVPMFSLIYAANMYFQSFGAVAIVKVNAAWFHVRERGVFSGIFGILISLGVYFAFDWGSAIVKHAPTWWVFFVPALVLAVFFVLDVLFVRDTPSDAGLPDIDTADATSGDTGPRIAVVEVAKRMLQNPVILTIVAIEFCSGFLRNAIMQWYPIHAKEIGIADTFVPKNWGLFLCIAGILGGVFAGIISDRVFDSRRGPVSAVLYAGMLLGGGVMIFALGTGAAGWVMVGMSLCIIGVHGMLSGTASMDFGGQKNAGVAVGIIDGFVYLGTAAQSLLYKSILPTGEAAKDPANWSSWPLAMIPVALIGLGFCAKVWNAKPKPKVISTAVPVTVPATE